MNSASAVPASATCVRYPRNPAPPSFTQSFREDVDAAGLSFLGSSYSLVNGDYTVSRDTTSPCGSSAPLSTGGTRPGKGGKPKL